MKVKLIRKMQKLNISHHPTETRQSLRCFKMASVPEVYRNTIAEVTTICNKINNIFAFSQ